MNAALSRSKLCYPDDQTPLPAEGRGPVGRLSGLPVFLGWW